VGTCVKDLVAATSIGAGILNAYCEHTRLRHRVALAVVLLLPGRYLNS
jgi:hypothetical protein